MIVAGVGWGTYSMRGRGTRNPAAATRDNFMLAVPLAAALLALFPPVTMDPTGVTLAVISGALTSGMGYIVWYSVVPCLTSVRAATVQLSVPVLAAAFGFILLGESFTAQQLMGAVAIFSGIALTMRRL
jgi:EamA-like transporter family.